MHLQFEQDLDHTWANVRLHVHEAFLVRGQTQREWKDDNKFEFNFYTSEQDRLEHLIIFLQKLVIVKIETQSNFRNWMFNVSTDCLGVSLPVKIEAVPVLYFFILSLLLSPPYIVLSSSLKKWNVQIEKRDNSMWALWNNFLNSMICEIGQGSWATILAKPPWPLISFPIVYFRIHTTCTNVCICCLINKKLTLKVQHWVLLPNSLNDAPVSPVLWPENKFLCRASAPPNSPLQGHGWECQTFRVMSDVNRFSIWVSERQMRQFKMPLGCLCPFLFAQWPDVSHLTWDWRDEYL